MSSHERYPTMADIKKQEFVIFDVETTGLSPVGGDRIIEIAALRVRNLEPVEEFHSLIDPQRNIPADSYRVNGISQDMLVGAPKSSEVLTKFFSFLGNAILVGHNVKFDLGFLCYELALTGKWLGDKTVIVDTLKMSRELLPHVGRYSLWFVAECLGIKKEQKHRAQSDVELTYDVFCRLVKSMGSKDISQVGVLPNALEDFKEFKNLALSQQQGVFNW